MLAALVATGLSFGTAYAQEVTIVDSTATLFGAIGGLVAAIGALAAVLAPWVAKINKKAGQALEFGGNEAVKWGQYGITLASEVKKHKAHIEIVESILLESVPADIRAKYAEAKTRIAAEEDKISAEAEKVQSQVDRLRDQVPNTVTDEELEEERRL